MIKGESCLLLTLAVLVVIQHGTCLVCETSEVAKCFAIVTETTTNCQQMAEANTIREELDNCMSKYTSGCAGLMTEQWQNALDQVVMNTEILCKTDCDSVQVELETCERMYSGIGTLAQEIISNNIQPTDTRCAIALKRIYVCIVNATGRCRALTSVANGILQSESEAFKQCNIIIQFTTATPTNGPSTNNTTGEPDTSAINSTKIVLYALLGISALIVAITGIVALYLWLHKLRNYNYIKGKENTFTAKQDEYKRDGSFSDRKIDNLFVRDRSPRRPGQYQYDTDADVNQFGTIGPYRSGARWWTRPNFGTYGADVQMPKPF